MNSEKRIINIAGWIVFGIAMIVYFMSAERTGSLWDCGEFVLGADKLQVVHPPGAALFLLIGRMFTMMAHIFTDTDAHPENIAFSVNILSGVCSAFAAMFICWTTMRLGRLTLVEREEETSGGQNLALAGAGIVAGLATAFCSSIWFSAVEGEVYAMSTFFTCLTLWTAVKWYTLPDTAQNDRWIVLTVYAGGLSIGVHLLSLLTFPALALFYYFKRYKKHNLLGMALAAIGGILAFVAIQQLVIIGIPTLWKYMELLTVNSMGLPFHSGIVPTLIILGLIFTLSLKIVHSSGEQKPLFYALGGLSLVVLILSTFWSSISLKDAVQWLLMTAGILFGLYQLNKGNKHLAQIAVISSFLVVVSFSTIGVVVIRANANTPVNMNAPSDPMRLLPYLNREQYGERPLLYGPNYDAKPIDNDIEPRYGQLDGKYQLVDEKISYVYNKKDKVFFPRMSDGTQNRPEKYKQWVNSKKNPTFGDNIHYLFKYQIGWMYWRYFMWNFAGRQNGQQGFYKWDVSAGHWASGIKPIDEMHLRHNLDELPDTLANNDARNSYYFLPIIFGLLGLFFHASRRRNDFLALLALFIITGIGIIIYSNQPPNEPRERDYVLVGSFFTFCIWIGMGALAMFNLLQEKAKLDGKVAAVVASLIVLSAPMIMGFQNFDDHSRAHHTGARDYASNFLESCAPNSIIFTYGDNDTYPLWYAQEVEKIRTDVRVVNLSLIAVDWYIDQLRRKVNDSAPIKMTVPRASYRGKKRNTTVYYNNGDDREMAARDFLKFIGEEHPLSGGGGRKLDSYMPTRNVYIPMNPTRMLEMGAITQADSNLVTKVPVNLAGKSYLIKDELAILDVIASNIDDRPIYFAVTCRPEKMFGLDDYMQLEGLGLRLTPVKTKSEEGLYVYGNGRVNTDILYDNVMNKFQWGGFDEYDTYVDRSYGPSVQSHRVVIMRAARQLVREGKKDKAAKLLQRYFEVFPHMNFAYDFHTWQMIRIMMDADAYEAAKPHIKTLSVEVADFLNFYFSLDPKHLDPDTGSYGQDFQLYMATKEQILRAVKQQGDAEFEQELQEMFKDFSLAKMPG